MLVEVLYWKMHGVHAHLLVVFHHLVLLYTPEAQITMSLNVEDSCDAGPAKSVDVVFCLGIRPQPYLCVAYLVKPHFSNEVGICFLDMPVDDKTVENVPGQI